VPPLLDPDWRLRLAAFDRLAALTERTGGVVTSSALTEGFEFEGERIRLWDAYRGIWRPRQLGRGGAALTIVTAPEHPGRARPYDDQIASDDDYFVYRYEREDPNLWTNVAVRRAMAQRRPLIYLYGIRPALYEAIFPCYIVGDDPDALAFQVIVAEAGTVISADVLMDPEIAVPRRYAVRTVKQRLHQRKFRELVVAAYRTTCTVCRLHHEELLDAAHILEDRDERGRPEVPNGLALCKIHHAAYDANILGVDPDYRIHIRRDILDEHDGPMLRHGLQEMEGELIQPPRRQIYKPNPEYLAERFERFRAA